MLTGSRGLALKAGGEALPLVDAEVKSNTGPLQGLASWRWASERYLEVQHARMGSSAAWQRRRNRPSSGARVSAVLLCRALHRKIHMEQQAQQLRQEEAGLEQEEVALQQELENLAVQRRLIVSHLISSEQLTAEHSKTLGEQLKVIKTRLAQVHARLDEVNARLRVLGRQIEREDRSRRHNRAVMRQGHAGNAAAGNAAAGDASGGGNGEDSDGGSDTSMRTTTPPGSEGNSSDSSGPTSAEVLAAGGAVLAQFAAGGGSPPDLVCT